MMGVVAVVVVVVVVVERECGLGIGLGFELESRRVASALIVCERRQGFTPVLMRRVMRRGY